MPRIYCQSRGCEIDSPACVPGDKGCKGCPHNHVRPPSKEIAAEAIKFFGSDADLFFSLCGSLKLKQQECLEAIKDVPEDPIADHPEEVIALAKKVNARDKVQERLLKLISWRTYLNAVDEVRRKRMPLDEKLSKVVRPFYEYLRLGGYAVGDTDFIAEIVDLGHDLDTNKLNYDKSKYYLPIGDPVLRSCSRIYLVNFEGLQDRYCDLGRLHKKWLPTLSQKKIIQDDLLTQVLVVYTIKKSVNGNKDAFEKLFKMYEKNAVYWARKKAQEHKFSNVEVEDIKRAALENLRLILSGWRPKDVFNALLKQSSLITLPSWIKKLYLYYLTEYGPQLIRIAIKKNSPTLLSLALNPDFLISPHTEWRGHYNRSFTDVKLLPKRTYRFNTYCYMPRKGSNLTIWLFGTEQNRRYGKYFQLLSDILKKWNRRRKKDIRNETWEDILKKPSRHEDIGHLSINGLEEMLGKFENMEDTGEAEAVTSPEESCGVSYIKEIMSLGFSERDASIYESCAAGRKKTHLAREYLLSRKQIYNIYKKIHKSLEEIKKKTQN